MKDETIDVVCHDNDSLSTAVKTPTFIKDDGGGESARVPSFAIELTNILLRGAMHEDRKAALNLVDLLTATSIDFNLYSGTSKAL